MMGKAGSRAYAGGVLLAALLAAGLAQAMPTASTPTVQKSAVVHAQFLGGPFFGRYGYNQPDPAKRHYFYDGYDPSLDPYKEPRPHRRWARRKRFHH